jgi:hypothetical protein
MTPLELIPLSIVLLPVSCAIGMCILLRARPGATLKDAGRALASSMRAALRRPK